MLGFGKKKAKDNATEPMQTVDELDDKEGVEPEPEAPVASPEAESEPEQPVESVAPSEPAMPEIKAQIEIPTYGILVSEGGSKSLHTIEDVSDTERYETILSEMYQLGEEPGETVVYSLYDRENMDSFESVKYLHFTMAHSPMTVDFETDTMLRRSALLDAHFANVGPIAGEGLYHASITEVQQDNYVSHFNYHLMFNGELNDESFETMMSLFYSTLEIHGYIIMDVDSEMNAAEEAEGPSDTASDA